MFYKQSSRILELIQNAKNILVNIHKNPDLDSIGAACSLVKFSSRLNKKITIVASHPVENSLLIFSETKKIKVINYAAFDFSRYDLFLVVDSSSYDRVTGSKKNFLPKLPTVVVDHHQFNTVAGEVKLVDTASAATCEIIYKLFVDWGVVIDRKMATMLYGGLMGDTVFFKYAINPKKAIATANKLLEKGADHQFVVERVYDSLDLQFVRLLGLFLEKMKVEKTKSGKRFVWSAIDYRTFFSFGHPKGVRETAADSFFRSLKGVDFGLAMVEGEKGKINISFRSKLGTDVSVMAKALGGGGHVNAAGATVEGKPASTQGEFSKTVKNIIKKIIATT